MRPLIIALTATIALTAPASAHAFLDHAEPPVGSTMQKAPRSLSLWFTEDLEPAFSGGTVTDTQGHTVNAGKSQVAPHNRRLMHVPVKALGPELAARITALTADVPVDLDDAIDGDVAL